MSTASSNTPAASVRSVAAATLLSRVLGLIRDKATVFAFSEASASALILSWTLPNLFRRLLGEGALAAALVPAIARAELSGGAEQRDRVTGAVIRVQLAFLLPLTGIVLGVLCFVPERWLLRAFESETVGRETLRTTVWMFPYVVLVCVGAQMQALANFMGRFFVPAVAPALVNVLWIAGVVIALAVSSGEPRGEWVAGAVLLAGFLQVGLQGLELWRAGARWRSAALFGPEVKEVFLRAGPMLLGLAASQVNLLVDRALAEAMVPGDGAVRNLYLANRLMQLPLGLVGISLATAAYPVLARAVAQGRDRDLGAATSHVLRMALAVCLPAALGLAALAGPIVGLLFEGGEFDAKAVESTASCLLAYAPAVLLQAWVLLLARVEYARDRAAHVMRMGIVAVVVNLVLDLALVVPLGAAGLALATTLATGVNALLLARTLKLPGGWARSMLRPSFAVSSSGVVMLAMVAGVRYGSTVLQIPDWWELPGSIPGRLPCRSALVTAVGMSTGSIVYFLSLRSLSPEVANELWHLLRRQRPITTEIETSAAAATKTATDSDPPSESSNGSNVPRANP